jgi:hypothetical protein
MVGLKGKSGPLGNMNAFKHRLAARTPPAKVLNVGTNSDIVFVSARQMLHGRKPQSISKTMGKCSRDLRQAIKEEKVFQLQK